VGSLHLVWDIADTLNGLMAIPNLIAVLASIGLVRRLTREFFAAAR
jgi:AGCS family alanine or glycine:cation symporter